MATETSASQYDDGTPPGRRDRLVHRRKALGLTQEDLAALLKVDRSTVVRWERGETEPIPWQRPRLAKALKVTADRLTELLDIASSRPGDHAGDEQRDERLATGGGRVAVVPRQLPATVRDFTGRAAEFAMLTEILDGAGDGTPGTVVISAIGGTAGVGKTALALSWAHRVADRFPDGQLHVNLRGFDPADAPATPEEAIRGFLIALGVPPDLIPSASDAQAGLYRSLLGDKRMLVVLDNARDEQQVRPLLPASPGSLVIVTSRNHLAGLAAAHAARLLSLDVLSHAEAVRLLTTRIGTDHCAAEPEAIAEIATLCACLPLALAVAAARAADRPRFPLSALAADLRDAAGRLDALDAADPAASVRAVFSWSYDQLATDEARLFRLLGLHPGPDISVPAAASLAAADKAAARRLLHALARAHLVTEHAPGRYTLHDLLRAYAIALVRGDAAEARRAATDRLLDHYLHTAHAGALVIAPTEVPLPLDPPAPGVAAEQISDYWEAMAWFGAEHQVLLAAITLAADLPDRRGWQIPWTMTHFLSRSAHVQDWVATQQVAVDTATRLGDLPGQAVSLGLLGNAVGIAGDPAESGRLHEQSLALCRQLGDRRGEANSHHALFIRDARRLRFFTALRHSRQALSLFRSIGDKAGEIEVLTSLSWFHSLTGSRDRARALCLQALSLIEETSHPSVEGMIWGNLGFLADKQRDFAEAARCYERAASTFRALGFVGPEVMALCALAEARHATGDEPRAREAWQRALVFLDLHDHKTAAEVRAKLTRPLS
jgi:transcriptional regulator with XRE-family HTH domain/tetratricopeptide (TPR) repeat protein